MTAQPLPPRTLVMGVVNVTPDSFSDGGRWLDHDAAIAHGLDLLAHGADVLDVGGESTRPGSSRPSPAEEAERVLPVVRALAARGAVVSVDTMRASVARSCVEAGAAMINDVSGGLADEAMLEVAAQAAAEHGTDYIAMHWRGHSGDMYAHARYEDVLAEVCDELLARRDAALAAGVPAQRLALDPGFGFAKTPEHSWRLLAGLPQVMERLAGHRVLIGTSRKGFLGEVAHQIAASRPGAGGAAQAEARPAPERDAATAATSVLAAQAGAWMVRVHDVRSTRDALAVLELAEAHR